MRLETHGCMYIGNTQLRVLLSKLLNISQCCVPPKFFVNRMLATLISCPPPPTGSTALSSEFIKDLHWFYECIPSNNCIYIIHDEDTQPINLFVDACGTCGGGGTMGICPFLPESLSCQGCWPGIEGGQVHVRSWKG